MRLIDKLRSDTSFFCKLANALMIGARRNDISIQHYFGCHGIITRCGQCYTVRIDPYTNQCSNIHLHRQTKRRVEDYKEILELARNQCDFKSMKDGWESYWKWGRVFHESLSASEAYDHASGNSCCILI